MSSKNGKKFRCKDCNTFIGYSYAEISHHNKSKRHLQNEKRNAKYDKKKQAASWTAGYGEDTESKFEITAQNNHRFKMDADRGSQDISRLLLEEIKQDKLNELLNKKRPLEVKEDKIEEINRTELKPAFIGAWQEVTTTQETKSVVKEEVEMSREDWLRRETEEEKNLKEELVEPVKISKVENRADVREFNDALKREKHFNFVMPKVSINLSQVKTKTKPNLE